MTLHFCQSDPCDETEESAKFQPHPFKPLSSKEIADLREPDAPTYVDI